MKTLRFLPFAAIFLATSALAQRGLIDPPMAKRPIRGPYLQVFVIDPPHAIDWRTPKTLFQSTLRNGLEMDYAPNGHLAIYLKTRRPNAYGVTEILTGMGRTNKMKTLWDTLYRQYGLTAMIHEFGGDLDSAEATHHELKKAAKDKRLSTITVQLTDATADRLMEFLGNWIRFGSFRHYGGGKNVPKGEGSGCADFAVHFIRLAMDGHLPSDQWDTTVFMPWNLLQEAPGRAKKTVSPLDLISDDTPWARNEREGLRFTIPDPEKMTKWVKRFSPYAKKVVVYPEDYKMREIGFTAIERFSAPYPREPEATIQEKWQSIKMAR